MTVSVDPKGLAALALFAGAMWWAADVRVGVVAALAVSVIDALSFGPIWGRARQK